MVDCNIDVAVKKYVEDLQVPSHYLQATEKMVRAFMTHEAYGNPGYKWSLDDFELGLKLGQGKFGRVFSGREKRTGYVVAIKTLMKVELVREGAEALVIREVEIQSHLKHPNILQLLTWFHDDFRVYLVLEYAGQGELYKSLKESPGGYFSDHLAAKYMYQVTDALNYCHTNHVLHRDIKPENIMLTTDGNIKLADFGWSAHSPSMKRDTLCGTLDYTPPEMLEGRMYGIGVDQWCLGILCYEFVTGYPPFESKTAAETHRKIKKVALTFALDIHPGAKDLISKLLLRDVRKRMSLPQIMQHPWIVENK